MTIIVQKSKFGRNVKFFDVNLNNDSINIFNISRLPTRSDAVQRLVARDVILIDAQANFYKLASVQDYDALDRPVAKYNRVPYTLKEGSQRKIIDLVRRGDVGLALLKLIVRG